MRDPGRFAGLHFFNPPTRMRVVEIVRGPATREETIAALQAVAERLGQRAFLVGDTPGFLVNHLGRGYVGEALRLLDEGVASPAAIDAIARGALGFRMGPFELLDLTGLDVTAEVTRQIWKGFGEEPRFALAPVAERRVAAGLLGRKTGRGFYEYDFDGTGRSASARGFRPTSAVYRSVSSASRRPCSGGRGAVSAGLVTSPPAQSPSSRPIGTDTATEARRHGLDPAAPSASTPCSPMSSPLPARRRPPAGVVAVRPARFAAAGQTSVVVRDGQGMPAQRLAAMIVLIAAEAAAGASLSPPTSMPRPASRSPGRAARWSSGIWSARPRISAIAAGLHALTGEPRWRPSAWLDARAKAGRKLVPCRTRAGPKLTSMMVGITTIPAADDRTRNGRTLLRQGSSTA